MKSDEVVYAEMERESSAANGEGVIATNPRFMIAGEAPILLGKACEMLVKEVTVRAWKHTERNRRRTLQKQDVHAAVGESEVYDFLIDIIPRVPMQQPSKGFTPPELPASQLIGAAATNIVNHEIPTICHAQQQQQPAASPQAVATQAQMQQMQYNMMYQQQQQQQQMQADPNMQQGAPVAATMQQGVQEAGTLAQQIPSVQLQNQQAQQAQARAQAQAQALAQSHQAQAQAQAMMPQQQTMYAQQMQQFQTQGIPVQEQANEQQHHLEQNQNRVFKDDDL